MPFLPDDLANSLAIQRLCDALETTDPTERDALIAKALQRCPAFRCLNYTRTYVRSRIAVRRWTSSRLAMSGN